MLIILDRDGVINEDSADFIKSAAEWHPVPGSLEAIASLNRAGHRVTVATNQSGLARGLFSVQDLTAIHQKMHDALTHVGGHLDGIFYCPHHPDENCSCRKPKPGLLIDIMERFGVPSSEVWMIGDAKRDLLAAKAAGCHGILVKTGKGSVTVDQASQEWLKEVILLPDLAAAAEFLIHSS